jgi:hypothetical protein
VLGRFGPWSGRSESLKISRDFRLTSLARWHVATTQGEEAAMLMSKLAVTLAAGIVLGWLVSWPGAAFMVAVVATALTLQQMRREVAALRAGE